MKNILPIVLLCSYFFTFLIGNFQASYDRVVPQILFVSLLNLISISYIFYKESFDDVYKKIKKSKVFIFFIAIIVFSGISIVKAINIQEAILVFSQYLTLFGCFFSIYMLSSKTNFSFIKFFFTIAFISCAIESIPIVNIIINKFIINGEPFLRSNELSGFSANINIVSYSLAIKFPVLIYLALKLKKKLLKILVYLIIISSSVVIIALLSRGAFLAWMISILIFFIISLIKDARIFIKPLIFVFVSITISYLFVGEFIDKAENTVQQRIESIEVDTDDASINQRLSYYAASIKIIKSSPLIGIGIGNWKLVSIKYLNNEMNEYIVAGFAHNDFLQLASEIGLIGLMCYIMIFYLIFFKLINGVIKDRNYLINLTLLVMLVVYFIDSMLNFPISRPISYIAMIFVLVSSMNINNSVRNEK